MAKIKIKDLTKEIKISDNEMRKIRGGFTLHRAQSLFGSFRPQRTLARFGRGILSDDC